MKTLMLDISQSVYAGTGVARFTVGLALELAKLNNKEYKVSFLCITLRGKIPDQILQACKTYNCKIYKLNFPPKLLCRVWNGKSIIGRFLTLFIPKSDIFISSDWAQPPRSVAKFNATVVHDLIFKVYPQTVDAFVRKTQEARLSSICANCNLVICDSLQTKEDFKKYYPSFAGNTVVIYPGVQNVATQDTEPREYSNYILSVGKVEPRKNYEWLIEAFNTALPQLPSNTKLIIVGKPGWGNVKIKQSEHVIWLQNVSDAQLTALYKYASLFIMPSLYEGFGYPLVEAFLHKIKTACSNVSSLAELGNGNCSNLFNPNNMQDIANVITDTLIKNQDITIENAYKKASNLNWQTYVDNLIASIYN